uniref:Transmembrane protein n=1 Tax=Rhizophora mucronata TaxID=61149 RepID=A0A2P2P1Z5_RHIMU
MHNIIFLMLLFFLQFNLYVQQTPILQYNLYSQDFKYTVINIFQNQDCSQSTAKCRKDGKSVLLDI